MGTNFSIGVVTYLGRFESHFRRLIRDLNFAFPDCDINVFINGHYDSVKQIEYIRKVTSFLRQYNNIKYVTHERHQPLARGWNWLVMMSGNDKILILNDDITVRPGFRYEIRDKLASSPDFFTINGSWSHFMISKEIVRKVGWFDERFIGVGDEDGDYMCRLAMYGIPIKSVAIPGIDNHVAEQNDCGWANFSSVIDGKYAQVNRDFFVKKWFHSGFEAVPKPHFILQYKTESYEVALKEPIDEMPLYYPAGVLDSNCKAPLPSATIRAVLAHVIGTIDAKARRAVLQLRFRLGRISMLRSFCDRFREVNRGNRPDLS